MNSFLRTLALAVLITQVVAAEPSRPNILLMVSDDQRPDSLHVLGNEPIETPVLDRLAARGTVFLRAYAEYPICHVSRAQIITGCQAFKALSKYPGGAINPKLATLAGAFHAAGYHTCYSGKWHNDGHPRDRGYDATPGLYTAGGAGKVQQPATDDRGRPLTGYRGWTFKDANNKPELDKGVGLQPGNSRHIADGAIQALKEAPRDKPFLLHVNFAFPHDPRQWPVGMKDRYAAAKTPLPPNFARQHPFDHGNLDGRDELLLPKPLQEDQMREELAIYHAMISDVDAQVGRLLATLAEVGHAEDTIIVFTADQGLALGSHGLLGKQNQYEHSIRSPLLIAGPGLPSGERSQALVTLSDIFPTLCDLAGIPIPASVEARSMVPLLRHEKAQTHAFVTGVFTDTQRMISDSRWKLIVYPQAQQEQLFDLQTDPWELTNLVTDAKHATKRDELTRLLREWQKAHGDPLANVAR